MSIALVNTGTYAVGTAGASLNPTISGYLAGDALLLSTSEFYGNDTLTTPSGWTKLSANAASPGLYIFGKIAASSSETIPTIAWGGTAISWAVIDVFRGVDPSFTTTASATDRTGTSVNNIAFTGASRTPTSAGLVYAVGSKNKTSASNGTSFTSPAGFTSLGSQAQAGAGTASTRGYWIQSTPTTVAAFIIFTGSGSDASAQTYEGSCIFLAAAPPPSGGGGTGTTSFPPPKRKTYVFYDLYYPR